MKANKTKVYGIDTIYSAVRTVGGDELADNVEIALRRGNVLWDSRTKETAEKTKGSAQYLIVHHQATSRLPEHETRAFAMIKDAMRASVSGDPEKIAEAFAKMAYDVSAAKRFSLPA